MAWHKPEPARVWHAVAIYLSQAYEGPPATNGVPASTPSAVRARLESLRMVAPTDFYASPVMERDNPAHPTRFGAVPRMNVTTAPSSEIWTSDRSMPSSFRKFVSRLGT